MPRRIRVEDDERREIWASWKYVPWWLKRFIRIKHPMLYKALDAIYEQEQQGIQDLRAEIESLTQKESRG